MISDEAVEAAAKSIARATIERESKLLHQFFPASDFKSDARAALEAAAPHMLADKDAEIDRLRAHILDIDAHATPFGDIPDDPGYVGVYLVSAGALHRALGKIGHTAPSCEAEAKLADAWDAGRQAGHDHMIGKQSTNPYRSQA